MPKEIVTTDISGQMVMLGTGTSVGVPAIGCGCSVCQSSHPRNQRSRSSVIMGLPEGNLLIDTSPDLRFQLLREKIGVVHAVAFTHEHADHLHGLDDVRLFPFYIGSAIPIYCEEVVEDRIRTVFDYAFADAPDTHPGARPLIYCKRIGLEPFEVLGAEIQPLRLHHGPRFEVLGFRIGNVAYCTDTNNVPEESMALLQGLDVLIIDGLRREPHATHFSVGQAVEVAERLAPKRTFLTHVCHDLDYETANEELPESIELAYDGLKIPLT